jgi:DNA-binding NarL/FixJ family response regulator
MKKTDSDRPAVRVAIIEDDAPLSRIFSGWIRRAEGLALHQVFPDAESALEELPTDPPDVVLVDINLPGLSGIECVRRLKPQLPKTQFVMVTVYEDADKIFSALQAGATGYLVKRTTQEELIAAIAEVHQGGSPMTSNIARKVVQSFQRIPAADDETAKLSPREREILDLLARGYLYKEIADQLKLSVLTVNAHIRSIYEKLHVHSRAQAVARYRKIE